MSLKKAMKKSVAQISVSKRNNFRQRPRPRKGVGFEVCGIIVVRERGWWDHGWVVVTVITCHLKIKS